MGNTHPLEQSGSYETMADRLMQGAERITESLEQHNGQMVARSEVELRTEQVGVFSDFADYLTDLVTSPEAETKVPMGRIILPPRTGKTVIAGQIIAGSGLSATVVEPTKALVEQVSRELRKQLPDTPVGVYYGEEKDLVGDGINVVSYHILQNMWRREKIIPRQIKHSALVFADEGHMSMTKARLEVLKEGFDPLAVRIALTATPEYNEERTLGRFFPDLIHEITLEEAVQLDLLSPLRVWVAEVDKDASEIRIVAGDFDQGRLSNLMGSAPFMEAARQYRYSTFQVDENDVPNIDRPALICCSSRQQAYDLYKYLLKHRPEGRSEPQVILGETRKDRRRRILEQFEKGKVDTIINVGVLLVGWNSPRCKLLIDLAPSLSRVRALQKFFRPMTKLPGWEARIYIVVPTNLRHPPILPMELFGWFGQTYQAGELIAAPNYGPARRLKSLKRNRHTPVDGVKLKTKVVLTARFEKPLLDPGNHYQVRQVVESNSAFSPTKLIGIQEFRWMLFRHPWFTGRGEQLLRYLRIPPNREGWITFIRRFYPHLAAKLYLWQYKFDKSKPGVVEQSCYDDADYFMDRLPEPNKTGRPSSGFVEGLRALAGPAANHANGVTDNPELAIIEAERAKIVKEMFSVLTPQEEKVLRMRFGIDVPKHTLKEISEEFEVGRERVRQIEVKAIAKLRHASRICKLW